MLRWVCSGRVSQWGTTAAALLLGAMFFEPALAQQATGEHSSAIHTEEQSSGEIPQLVDITARTGVYFTHLSSPNKKYIVESMSGGVALIDYDRDGWLDFFTNAPDVAMSLAGIKARSALYHNNHDGTFTDVTDEAGVGHPCWAKQAHQDAVWQLDSHSVHG